MSIGYIYTVDSIILKYFELNNRKRKFYFIKIDVSTIFTGFKAIFVKFFSKIYRTLS